MGLDGWGWLAAGIAAFLVGMAKGGLTMVGTIAVPLLALAISPVQAAGILLPVYVLSDLAGLIAFRRSFDRRVVVSLLPGAVFGIALGWATARMVDERRIGLIVGLIGLAFAARTLLGQRLHAGRAVAPRGPGWGRGTFWGALTGYASFVSHSGGPPYQVYVQPLGMEPMVFAGTTTIFFAVCNAVKLIPYAVLGQLSVHNMSVAAALVVPALAGVLAGLWILRNLPTRVFYGFVTWALLAVSARLVWTGL